MNEINNPLVTDRNNEYIWKVGSAFLYALTSFLITISNKIVLTTYQFPSFNVLGIGQMLSTILILAVSKRLHVVHFVPFSRNTFIQMWPLQLIFFGNLIFGLGGTKELSLPMFTVLRRFSILMTMFGELVILNVHQKPKVQICVYAMVIGAIVAASHDLSFNFHGYIYVLLSDFFTAANGVYMKKKLIAKEFVFNFKKMLKFNQRYFCNFQTEFQRKQIPISSLQKILLTFGSAAISIYNPRRADMIACLSEVTGLNAIQYMFNQMTKSAEGQQVLTERPRINSKTVDLVALKNYPNGTLGKAYSNFLETNKVTPDSRQLVQFIDDSDLAYVLQRYRENHDLIHTLLGMPTNMLGEVTVKWVEAIQTHLPMCIGAAILGPIRLKPKHQKLYKDYYLPWAIRTGVNSKFLMNIYFEKRWNQSIDEIYKEFNIEPLQIIK